MDRLVDVNIFFNPAVGGLFNWFDVLWPSSVRRRAFLFFSKRKLYPYLFICCYLGIGLPLSNSLGRSRCCPHLICHLSSLPSRQSYGNTIGIS